MVDARLGFVVSFRFYPRVTTSFVRKNCVVIIVKIAWWTSLPGGNNKVKVVGVPYEANRRKFKGHIDQCKRKIIPVHTFEQEAEAMLSIMKMCRLLGRSVASAKVTQSA